MRFAKLVVILISIDARYTLADSCDAILDEKLMTASSIVDQSEAESAAKYVFCNKSYSEVKKSSSGSIGGDYKFISASASKDESSFNKWKQSNCGNSSSYSAAAKYRFSAQKALGEGVVEAWRACMLEKDGLSCLVSPGSDNDSVNFIYSWKPKGTGKTELLGSTIYNGSRLNGKDERTKVAKDNASIYAGKQSIIVIRDDTSRKTIISMNTLYNGDIADECHVEVPAVVSQNSNSAPQSDSTTTIKGRWCYSSSSGPYSSGVFTAPSVEFVQRGENWQEYLSPTQGSRIPSDGVDRVDIEKNGNEVIVTEVSKDMMLPPPKTPSLYFKGPFPAPSAPVTPSRTVPGVIPAPGTAPLPAPSGTSEGLIITTSIKYEMPDNNTLQAKEVSVTTNVTGDENSGNSYPLIRYSRCD